MKDGGPAFPRPGNFDEDQCTDFDNFPAEGMSLRDWFAGMAVSGFIADNRNLLQSNGTKHCPATLAIEAYRTADAMIAEREKEAE